MRVPIRWKLMASYLLLTFVIAGVVYVYLSRALERYMIEETREGLLSEGRLARLMVDKEITDLRKEAPAIASSIKKETRSRVTIISIKGEVLGDSDVMPEELKELENHLQRPEVQEALKTGQGQSIRHSATLQMPMLYVAFPFNLTSGEQGILRLALPLSAFQKTKASLHTILAASLVIAIIISLILSYILSNVTSRSLRTITAVAARIGKGEFGRRIPVRSHDELGELAGVMNEMAVQIEQQLARLSVEKNRLNTIVRGMGEGLLVIDARGVVILVNPAFRTLFAIQEEVEGRPLIEITRHPALQEAFASVLADKTERLEEISLKLREEKFVLTHLVPLMENEAIQGVVAVFHDITDLKRLESIRKDFVANVSHELRTPVAVIKGFAESLLHGVVAESPAVAERFIEKILSHSERLTSLINDLLALSELESGGISLQMKPVSMKAVVKQATTLLEPKAQKKNISLTVEGLDLVPPVFGDSARLEQVVINLLDNAIKYTPESGSISISAAEVNETVGVSVTDTGVGIPPKDLPRIFERFYRVDSARSRELGGTGLGLAIVKHILQLHGGSISVTSTPGTGSTFSFTLPKA